MTCYGAARVAFHGLFSNLWIPLALLCLFCVFVSSWNFIRNPSIPRSIP